MANRKTFLPELARVAQRLCNYMRRYEATIKSFMDDDQKAIFDAALAACEALDAVMVVILPPET